MFAVRNYQQGVQRLCAACDDELLGTKYSEGRFRLDVASEFYDGMRVDGDALSGFLRQCTIANLVGERTVALAIGLGLIEPQNVLRVEGVPHAQLVVIQP